MSKELERARVYREQSASLHRASERTKNDQQKAMMLNLAALYQGMAGNGITGDLADEIYEKIEAFANFGFAESHSISFAYLVYASAFFKKYYPAAFCAAS